MTTLQHEVVRFKGNKPGPRLLIFGAIHGNEVCGPIAIKKIISEIQNSDITIEKGEVAFVPVCNLAAYKKNVRLIKHDLNRTFTRYPQPADEEEQYADFLARLVEEFDILFDLHSTTADGPMSVFVDFPTQENISFAHALNAYYALYGWPELYDSLEGKAISLDTTTYAHKQGKITTLLECGQHTDPLSVDCAYAGIIAALAHFGIIEGVQKEIKKPVDITFKYLFFKESNDDRLIEEWGHLDFVKKGEQIATRKDGSIIVADEDGFIILPKHGAKAGQEWFYFGRMGLPK